MNAPERMERIMTKMGELFSETQSDGSPYISPAEIVSALEAWKFMILSKMTGVPMGTAQDFPVEGDEWKGTGSEDTPWGS